MQKVPEPIAATPTDLQAITALFKRVVAQMRAAGLMQWDERYPAEPAISADIANGSGFVVRGDGDAIAGYVALDTRQPVQYAAMPFTPVPAGSMPLVVHRLAVDPLSRGRGLARAMMAFADQHARRHGHFAIRLDAFSLNATAVAFYERLSYRRLPANLYFPHLAEPFYCFERVLETGK